MAQVTIYTRPGCGYCARALQTLQTKGADFTQIDVGADPSKRAEMVQRAGGASTFPQIFVGEKHIGGCDDMMALEHQGKLDDLLAA